MSPPRVLVFGYDRLVLSSLAVVRDCGHEVAAVVFPSTRTEPRVAEVREEVEGWGHPVIGQPPRAEIPSFSQHLRELEADVGLVWSYPMILPPEVFEAPRLGCVNVHPSALPAYRGTDVLQWMLMEGAEEAGVTLHAIDEGVDTGPIIAQTRFDIEAHDTLRSLMIRTKSEGEKLLGEWWPRIAEGHAPSHAQDSSVAFRRSVLKDTDRAIQWTRSSAEVAAQVRALGAPDPGAWTTLHDRRVILRACAVVDGPTHGPSTPGVIKEITSDGPLVGTGSGWLRLLEVEVPNPSTLPQGFGMGAGDRLGG